MKTKILVPTDFSKTALNALQYAIKMHANEPCDFYVLNAFFVDSFALDSILAPEPGEKMYEIAAQTSKNELQKLLINLEPAYKLKNHHFHLISKFSFPLEAIEVLVEEMDIEIIVMGTNGANDRRAKLYGSNTVITMRKVTNCPVLAIPQNAQFPPHTEIVFITDFMSAYKKSELVHLMDITRKSKVPLRILHVTNSNKLNETQLKNKERLPEYLEDITYSFHTVTSKNIVAAVQVFTESRNSGMVVIINRKNGFLKRLFAVSKIKELASYATIPIMALHDSGN